MIQTGNDKEIILVLEPGNLRRLREGDPIRIDLSKFGLPGTFMLIAYTPDVEWLSQELGKRIPIESGDVFNLINESLKQKEVDRARKVS